MQEVACEICGKPHKIKDLEVSYIKPDVYLTISEEIRKNSKLSDDLCQINWERYFVRSVLPIPMNDFGYNYHFGIWVEVSEEDFNMIVETWQDENPTPNEILGVLANDIQYFQQPTDGLKGVLKLVDQNKRPQFYLRQYNHELCQDQKNGVSSQKAASFNHLLYE